jgi:hypothetical protein
VKVPFTESIKVMVQVEVVKHRVAILVLLEVSEHSWLEITTTLRSVRESEVS